MPEKPSLRRPDVLERDMDELLARKLTSDMAFSSAFIAAVAKQVRAPITGERVSVSRQVRHEGTTGTIDLLLHLFTEGPFETGRILIENKVNSSFTPNQPERYASSAVAMSRTGRPAVSVICAPAKYIARSKYLGPFHAQVSYEQLANWLRGSDRTLVGDAILRFEMPYEPDPVPAVADFHEGYAEVVRQIAPELIVKPNPNTRGERPEASRTIYFATAKTLPKWEFLPTLRFSHQCWDSSAPNPSVKVMFGTWAKHEHRVRRIAVPALGNTQLYLRKAGDSLGLVHDTPRLENTRPVSSQMEAVVKGIRAAAAIRAWIYANEAALRDWAGEVAGAERSVVG